MAKRSSFPTLALHCTSKVSDANATVDVDRTFEILYGKSSQNAAFLLALAE